MLALAGAWSGRRLPPAAPKVDEELAAGEGGAMDDPVFLLVEEDGAFEGEGEETVRLGFKVAGVGDGGV